VVQVITGLFGDRMAEMLRRRGATVVEVRAELGHSVQPEALARALATHRPVAVYATHVDTSTGVLLDPEPVASLARDHGALSVFDGVCAAAAERFEMAAWGADIYLTASQKALSVPPGLALWVCSQRAMDRRAQLSTPPPMTLDLQEWSGVMQAYEARRGAYFSTPATSLVSGLCVSLAELAAEGAAVVADRHVVVAAAMRRAWEALGLQLVAAEGQAAHTLSALRYPDGVDASLLSAVKAHGVVIAGGLHPELKSTTFRVGHMGYTTTCPEVLVDTVRAVGNGLRDLGRDVDVDAAVAAFEG